jgi:hypothetical protein
VSTGFTLFGIRSSESSRHRSSYFQDIHFEMNLPSMPNFHKLSLSFSILGYFRILLNTFLIFPMRVTCLAYAVLLEFISLMAFGEQYVIWSPGMCNFLPRPLASPFMSKYSPHEVNTECGTFSEVLTAVNINLPSSSLRHRIVWYIGTNASEEPALQCRRPWRWRQHNLNLECRVVWFNA